MNRDYIVHRLIGTPWGDLLRHIQLAVSRLTKPRELRDVVLEKYAIKDVLRRYIKNPMNCIDVGTHLGMSLQTMIDLSPNGEHMAFEPVAEKFGWLKKKYPKVEVFDLALSDHSGEVEFYVTSKNSGYSGLRKVLPETPTNSVKIRCERLDNLVPETKQIHLIKMIIEGADLFALRGSKNIISRCRPAILFECTEDNTQAFSIGVMDVYNFLVTDQNYSIYLFKDWLADKSPLVPQQFERATQYPYRAFNFWALPN